MDHVPEEVRAGAPPSTGVAPLPQATIVIGPLVVQSGATPIVGLVMLLVGIVVGLLLRPLLPFSAGQAVAQANPTSGAARSGSPVIATPTVDPGQQATEAAGLMQVVLGQTRHFRGNPDAQVVIVEFSDFQ